MPTKVTRSAKPAPKPHKPTFPVRKPKLVKAAEAASVATINPGVKTAKAHYWGDKEARRFHIAYIVAIVALVLTFAAMCVGIRHVTLSQMVANKLCSTVGKSDRLAYGSLWLEEQPGWETPRERTDLLELCYERSRPF